MHEQRIGQLSALSLKSGRGVRSVQGAVEAAVLDRLGDVGGGDVVGAGEVGDGARDLAGCACRRGR